LPTTIVSPKKNLKILDLETELKDSEYRYQKQLDEFNDKYKRTLENLEDAKNSLDIKPKEVIIEKEVIKEIIKEIPVEKIIEKVVKVEVPVEVEKETVVTVEKEVPGPERIVEVPGPERRVEVPGPERIVEKIVKVENTAKMNQVQMQVSSLQKERDALQRQVNELLQPPKEVNKKPPPNSWTFTPKNAELPVDNEDQNKNSKYYIKKP